MNNRDKILEAAVQVFLEFGFNGASIAKIVKAAEVSNGAVFHYFKNKEELVNASCLYAKKVYADYLKENMVTSGTVKDTLESLWRHSVLWGLANPELSKFFRSFADSSILSYTTIKEVLRTFRFVFEIFKAGIAEGSLIREDVIFLTFHAYNSTNASRAFLATNPRRDLDMFLAKAFRMYWRSIVNL